MWLLSWIWGGDLEDGFTLLEGVLFPLEQPPLRKVVPTGITAIKLVYFTKQTDT